MSEKPKPFLKRWSDEEIREILHQAYEASERGDQKEYDRLAYLIPIIPGSADDLKRYMGIEALIASGLNLIDAVEAYGEDWLRA